MRTIICKAVIMFASYNVRIHGKQTLFKHALPIQLEKHVLEIYKSSKVCVDAKFEQNLGIQKVYSCAKLGIQKVYYCA